MKKNDEKNKRQGEASVETEIWKQQKGANGSKCNQNVGWQRKREYLFSIGPDSANADTLRTCENKGNHFSV